jgi:hypothetical protein
VTEFLLNGLFACQEGERRSVEAMGFQSEDRGLEGIGAIERRNNFPYNL